jgi:hypothetical protein
VAHVPFKRYPVVQLRHEDEESEKHVAQLDEQGKQSAPEPKYFPGHVVTHV